MPRRPDAARPWNGTRVRDLRHLLHLSQTALAHELNVSAQAIRSWEQDSKRPSGTAARLLDLFESHPELIGTREAIGAHRPPRPRAGDTDDDDAHRGATAAGRTSDADRAPAIAQALGHKLLPEWWREEAIVRLVTALYRYVRQYADPYSLLVAPREIDGVPAADARAGYPDIYVIAPEPTLDGRRASITSLRLAIDVLPVHASASVTAASRVRDIAIEEHWLVDPFAHRVTVRRVADSTTRHHRREIVWRITPYARPVSVFVRPLFMPTLSWPIILEPTPSPGLVEATAEVLG
jgi:transcriptional regulator with XRE-family HTH domain